MTIKDSGKFEGEPEYVPHFWSMALEGGSDEDVDGVFVFRINSEDLNEFPGCFDKGDRLLLWEDDQGFVHHRVLP